MFERMLGYANHLGLVCRADGAARGGARQFSAGVYPSGVDQRGISIWIGSLGGVSPENEA